MDAGQRSAYENGADQRTVGDSLKDNPEPTGGVARLLCQVLSSVAHLLQLLWADRRATTAGPVAHTRLFS